MVTTWWCPDLASMEAQRDGAKARRDLVGMEAQHGGAEAWCGLAAASQPHGCGGAMQRRPDLISSLGSNAVGQAHDDCVDLQRRGSSSIGMDPTLSMRIHLLASDLAPKWRIDLPLRGFAEDESDLPPLVAHLTMAASPVKDQGRA
ncbi:hypothetical protein SORBI_3010G108401 [Sorghum bicolor]|uniref:Uncharacterized protein n=1 Tax=Sorghum bicolor TaxID=4558 RepID=A0A1W0VSE2_SORBI|nr:hypothetical protein SORBI_3010G108401 [Sorghum bicolor]